jgi:hypothetical protein
MMLEIGKKEFKLYFTPTKVIKWFDAYDQIGVEVKQITASLTRPDVNAPYTEFMKAIIIDQRKLQDNNIVGSVCTLPFQGNNFAINWEGIENEVQKMTKKFHALRDYKTTLSELR